MGFIYISIDPVTGKAVIPKGVTFNENGDAVKR